jgi:predicted RNA-binding protein Jag
MEITKKNRGDYVGYKDEETCIFSNEDNYQEKFKEYLNDIGNPKWEKIAAAGREFTLDNLNNKKAVKDLIEIMTLYI